jgi:hypothetical protein
MKRFFPLLLLTLTGCATLNENQCLTADWGELGRQDGRAGYTAARLAEHREACLKHGVRPDEQRYADGRAQGLHDYCILDNAIREGINGRRYQSVCPSGIDHDFRDLNDAAYRVYIARKDIVAIDNALDSLERELRNTKTSEKRRKLIRDEIRDLDRKRERQRDELRWIERELDATASRLLRGSPGRY